MTDRQENKISSYIVVDGYLKRPECVAVWMTDADFAGHITHFQSMISEILDLQAIQEKDKSGGTIRKSGLRTSLENAILDVVHATVAHALLINDPDLLTAVDYSIRDLQLARDSSLLGIATVVYDSAWPIRVALAARHITEADITLVSTLRDQFLALIPEPRTNIVLTMTATVDLKNKIMEMDAHLRFIDRVILMFKKANPNFIDNFKSIREIIDLGPRHSGKQVGRVTGTILQAGTLIPLQNVTIVVVGTMRRTKTDANGHYSLIFRTKSVRILRVTLDNHQIYTSNALQINPGELINLNIQLQPIE
jgi:hypothetical protein